MPPYALVLVGVLVGLILGLGLSLLIVRTIEWRRRGLNVNSLIEIQAALDGLKSQHKGELERLRKTHFVRLASTERRANVFEDKLKKLEAQATTAAAQSPQNNFIDVKTA
jgi:hypothetical protein